MGELWWPLSSSGLHSFIASVRGWSFYVIYIDYYFLGFPSRTELVIKDSFILKPEVAVPKPLLGFLLKVKEVLERFGSSYELLYEGLCYYGGLS